MGSGCQTSVIFEYPMGEKIYMKEILDEEWLCLMLDAARNSRVKQLKEEFAASTEYGELIKVKDDMLDFMKQELTLTEADLLFQYGEACSMIASKTGNYFYEKGFADCLHLLGQVFADGILK